jgi:Domain of Unknown Function with PDB structure (DUF3857)/Transglutaminase-like superfamily
MRYDVFVRHAVLFLSLVSPSLLMAQFQEPSKEELQMTADPKAPGADAVYFYREETTDDTLHFHGYYERIKVLTEKGKEMATIRIPYEHGDFKVADIRGRTIHSDGTVIPLTARPSDLVDVKTRNYQINTMVFTLPSVEVGSILEYRLQIRYADNLVSEPTWDVQQPHFVHKAHYFFAPSKSDGVVNSRGELLSRLMYMVHAGNDAKVVRDASGRYSFDATDIPAIPSEDWMPPLNSFNWRVEFYYTQYSTSAEFWQNEGKRWTKETERFTNPKPLQQIAAQIVAPGDTDEQKARKIYDAVMKLDNTSFSREKTAAERKSEKLKAIRNADDVWNQKSGSDDEIAMLYVALARAAGLTVYPMQVVNRNRAIFDRSYLSTSQLDDYIAIAEIGGKEVYLDPGQKMCPFGLLHWKHTIAGGIRLSASGPGYAVTPAGAYRQTQLQRFADLTMDADTTVIGTVRFVMTGQEALRWRQLRLKNDDEEVKKQFVESIRADIPDGLQPEFDHFLALDDPNSNLMGAVKVNGALGTATGKRYFLPGQFFESRGKHPFVAEDKRTIPVDVLYARMATDQVSYRLPPGLTVESAPQATDASWPDRALLKIASVTKEDSVVVARTLAYNFTVLDPNDYVGLHDFYQKVATADQQQLVLTHAAVPAKGN